MVICFITLITLQVNSQTINNGQFLIRGNGDDDGRNIIELADGNFLYNGTTTSYGNGGKDILVIKFGKDFSILWQKTIGGVDDEYVFDRPNTFENPDGSIMILGNTSSGVIGGDDFLLIKLDASGAVIWTKAYGGTNDEAGVAIAKCLDGGFIMGGKTASHPAGKKNIYLVKTTASGGVEWNWSFGNNSLNGTQISEIITLQDSSYIFSGIYDGFPSQSNSFIARINKNGVLQWINTYTSSSSGGSGVEGIFGLNVIGNSIIGTGMTLGKAQFGGFDGIIISLDFNGNVNWSKVYGGSGNDWLYKADEDNTQNITIASYSNSVGFGDYDIGLFKVDLSGNALSYKIFGSTGTEQFKHLFLTSDGGVIFSGSTTGFNSVLRDGYITKVDANWSGACNDSNATILESAISISPQNLVAPSNNSGSSALLSLSSTSVTINFDTLCINPAVSIDEIDQKEDVLNIFPNPFSDIININMDNNTDATIRIFDISGKLITNYTVNKLSNKVALDMKNIEVGVYFVTVTDFDLGIIKSGKIVKLIK